LKITVYGGAAEIGGNKILLQAEEASLFLDFGISFAAKRRFFGTFLQPRRFNLISDYVLTGVLPSLVGVYRRELLRESARHLDQPQPSAAGCVITHAHLDHCGHAPLLRADIPILMGAGTRSIIECREKTRSSSTPENVLLSPAKETQRSVSIFRTGDIIRLGDFAIEPVHVDHSVPAAYGTILETSDSALAYSGDFRLHGPMGNMTLDFIKKCVDKSVNILIIEGTRIDEAGVHSEESVRQDLTNLIREAGDNGVITISGLLDFDRLKSLLAASWANSRTLVVSMRQARLLESLAEHIETPKLEPERLAVYLERRGSGRYERTDYKGWMSKFLGQLMDRGAPLIRDEEINRHPEKYVLALTQPEDIVELASINPPPASKLILSTSEPHTEEQILEMEKIHNWANLMRMSFSHVHASGHASGREIVETVRRISPEIVIPIHTEAPELFEQLLGAEGIKAKIVKPRTGEPMTF